MPTYSYREDLRKQIMNTNWRYLILHTTAHKEVLLVELLIGDLKIAMCYVAIEI